MRRKRELIESMFNTLQGQESGMHTSKLIVISGHTMHGGPHKEEQTHIPSWQ